VSPAAAALPDPVLKALPEPHAEATLIDPVSHSPAKSPNRDRNECQTLRSVIGADDGADVL
jgi:hypothetical protein